MSSTAFDASLIATRFSAALPPDVLHGMALCPPDVRWDGLRYSGSHLVSVKLADVNAMAGVVAAVQRTHFAGVVAVTPLYARQAVAALAPVWQADSGARAKHQHQNQHQRQDQHQNQHQDQNQRQHQHESESESESGSESDKDKDTVAISYSLRPAQGEPVAGVHVVVWCLNGHTGVWLPSTPREVQQLIKRELATLLLQDASTIQIKTNDDSQQQSKSHQLKQGTVHQVEQCAVHPLDLMDAAAQAALLSQAVGRPVSVACRSGIADTLVLTVQERAPSDRSQHTHSSQHSDVTQAVLASDRAWAVRPSLARMLSQPAQSGASAQATACTEMSVVARNQPAAPWHASVDDLNAVQIFAQESQWHEQALAQGQDPLAWRLDHMPEGQGKTLARQVASRAGRFETDDSNSNSNSNSNPKSNPEFIDDGAGFAPGDGLLRGSGFATAQVQYTDEADAECMMWSAWVVEVAVQPNTGHVEVTRVVAGHDSAQLHAAHVAPIHPALPAHINHQDPHLLANARSLLAAPAAYDDWVSPTQLSLHTTNQNGSDSLTVRDAQTDLSTRRADEIGLPTQGRLSTDGVITLPAAAAIANAIHAATGVRLRQVPFESEQLRLALADQRGAQAYSPLKRSRSWLLAGAAGLVGLAAMAWPLKSAIPLTAGADISLYSTQAIERGRLVAAAGDCLACHTAPGGTPNTGGLALDTPFGTIYSTNITPDKETGIGLWSFAAFDRAMRQGIHQDGRQLYPAFPYTAFAKLSEGDMQALYGYLMTQPAVKATPPQTKLAFPFNMRPLLAGWNMLFLDDKPFAPDPSRSPEWLRGAYLVEGIGHCAACHSPRNSLGAEKNGLHYLAGGEAEGWTAPALNQLALGERGWTKDELQQYLSTGYSPRHGVAAGPMAPVIHGLEELPASDIGAIATYLLDLPNAPVVATPDSQSAPAAIGSTATLAPAIVQSPPGSRINGERIFQNACAACHDATSGPTLFGVRPLLDSNTNLHADTPDNLIQVILNGIQTPANDALGFMPGFAGSLDDKQITDLVGYLRERFAPDKESWPIPTDKISKLREHAQPN